MIFHSFSRKGIILVLFASLAFLVTILLLANTSKVLQQQSPGVQAFGVLEDLSIARKTTFYVEQSFRNSAFTSFHDLSQDSFFPKKIGGKTCPFIQGKPLLFSSASCAYTPLDIKTLFAENIKRASQSYFSSPIYGIPLSPTDFPFSLTEEKNSLHLDGHSASSFSYTGKEAGYNFRVPYKISLPFSFSFIFDALDSFQGQLACISSEIKGDLFPGPQVDFVSGPEGMSLQPQTLSEFLQKQCPLSHQFTWSFEKAGDVLFVTVEAKNKPSFLDYLSFAFAIPLNNLQTPPVPNTLFGG